MSEPATTDATETIELTKAEKRKLSRKRKKQEQWEAKQLAKKRPKMTKEERRMKYTQKFHDKQKNKRNRNVTCFKCRKAGHMAADCPEDTGSTMANICYKCGSTEHRLFDCKKYKGIAGEDLPYATCFICKKMGHLSSQCEKNDNGMYPDGGCCKICGKKDHLSSKCPKNVTCTIILDKEPEQEGVAVDATEYVNDGAGAGDDQPIADSEDDMKKGGQRKGKKVVKF